MQKELGLPQEPAAPLVGIVGRLIDQKGFDLVAEVMQRWVQTSDVQWVILGTGQPKYHKLLETPGRALPAEGGRCGWSSPIRWPIASRPAADMFLMPSRFEPCGLNQLYSLKYGTVPLVRATGGLADTIVGYGAAVAERRPANGFVLPGVQPAGPERDPAPGLRRSIRRPDDLAATDRHRHAAGLVVGPQREAIRRVVPEDAAAVRGVGVRCHGCASRACHAVLAVCTAGTAVARTSRHLPPLRRVIFREIPSFPGSKPLTKG